MSHHLIAGKKTTTGHMVHYVDHQNQIHAALIKNLAPTASGHSADLHVFHSGNGSDNHVEQVPHSATPAPHTWHHIPE